MKHKTATIRQLHDFKGKFNTVKQLKSQIHKEFTDEIPTDSITDIGYFEGRQSSKIWLVSDRDVISMYQKVKKDSDIFLWIKVCESDSDDELEPVRKKRRSSKEDEVEDLYQELRQRHEEKYTSPQLKLWARMLHCGTHGDYIDPPRVPMITGTLPKHTKKDSFAQALTGAAEAVVKILSPRPISVLSESNPISANTGISPGKSTELRTQNLQQLRVLQQLHDENVLSDSELAEQKSIILDALRKLT